jgi:hypothetical protein
MTVAAHMALNGFVAYSGNLGRQHHTGISAGSWLQRGFGQCITDIRHVALPTAVKLGEKAIPI